MIQPIDVVETIVERYNSGDLDGLVGVYAENALVVSDATYRGRDEIRAHFAELRSMFGDAILDDVVIHEAGETAVVECVHVGRTATNVAVRLPMVMVFDVAGGLVRANRTYVNSGVFAELLLTAPSRARSPSA